MTTIHIRKYEWKCGRRLCDDMMTGMYSPTFVDSSCSYANHSAIFLDLELALAPGICFLALKYGEPSKKET